MYWLYKVAGIVQLLLVAGVICNRQFYRVKLLFREMANISCYSNIFRGYCFNISFLVDGIYVYLENTLNQLINTKIKQSGQRLHLSAERLVAFESLKNNV